MADKRLLGIGAPQAVIAVRRGSEDATKEAWYQRHLAKAATYRERLVEAFGPAVVARFGSGTAAPAIRSHDGFRAVPGTKMLVDDD